MTFKELIGIVVDYINLLIPVVFALTLVAFLWGVFRYIFTTGSEEDMKKGKEIMFWGILVLAIMLSTWGILNALRNSFLDVGSATPSAQTTGISGGSSTGGTINTPLPRPKPGSEPEEDCYLWGMVCF